MTDKQNDGAAVVPVVTWCPQCGPEPRCDDDGCCAACGATVGEVPDWKAAEQRGRALGKAEGLEMAAQVCFDGTIYAVTAWDRARKQCADAIRKLGQTEGEG